MTAPAVALAHLRFALDASASDALRSAQALRRAHWLRPPQRVPRGNWRSFGIISGRGWGKTRGLASELNRRVERGECTRPALIAPILERVREVQVTALVQESPPWCRAEPYRDGVRWSNGVVTEVFTPDSPGRSRSGNFDFVWLTELVDWQHTTRREAFDNITTACRVGAEQYVWDTTPRGKNNVIRFLIDQHEAEPTTHLLVRGAMFDNPFLSARYLQDEARKYVVGSRRYREEVLGEVFDENAGALWQQAWIDDNRVAFAPNNPQLIVLGCDPALSDRPDSDETGLIEIARDNAGELYVTRDMSGRYPPEKWGDLIVDRCMAGASGVVIERNHIGDNARANIRARAKERGMRVEIIPHGARAPFPRRVPGTIVIREVVSRTSKGTRAHPVASLYQLGHVHHAAQLDELELQLTTWEPDTPGESPNRLDALCEAINELAETLVDKPGTAPGTACAARDAQKELTAQVAHRASRRLGI